MLPLLIGFLSGIIGGMGVGGGMLLIPAAKIFMGLSQQSAQALNLYCFIPSSVCAIFVHLKNKQIEFKGTARYHYGRAVLTFGSVYFNTHFADAPVASFRRIYTDFWHSRSDFWHKTEKQLIYLKKKSAFFDKKILK